MRCGRVRGATSALKAVTACARGCRRTKTIYGEDSLYACGPRRWVSDFWGVGYVGSRVTAEHPYPPTVHSTSPTASRPIPSYPPTPTRSLETLHNIPQTKESSIAGGSGAHEPRHTHSKVQLLTSLRISSCAATFWGVGNRFSLYKRSRETTRSLDYLSTAGATAPAGRPRRGARAAGAWSGEAWTRSTIPTHPPRTSAAAARPIPSPPFAPATTIPYPPKI